MALDRAASLWMGGIEPYMNEEFLLKAFEMMGEKPVFIKLMRNKQTGVFGSFGFVQFMDSKTAIEALHKLNGKIIPFSTPPVRFKLNTNRTAGSADYSLWVGDLTPDVDDYLLYKTFATRYNSLHMAKLVRGPDGESRGYGFVMFTNEEEYKDALVNMTGFRGLGSMPIRVSHAIPRSYKPDGAASIPTSATNAVAAALTGSATGMGGGGGGPMAGAGGAGGAAGAAAGGYGNYYDPNYQNYGQWQGQQQGYGYQGYYDPSYAQQWAPAPAQTNEDDFEVIEYDDDTEVQKLNKEYLSRSRNMWDELERSRWSPVPQRDFSDAAAVSGKDKEKDKDSGPSAVAVAS